MSETQLPTFDQLIELLGGVLSGNNEKIQYATKILRRYTKLPDCVGPLMQIISQPENSGHKHLASILLRKCIGTLYSQLNEQAQTELKALLLQRFMEEKISVVKKQIGYAIGLIAQQTLRNGQWNELYQVLQQQTDTNMEVEKRKNGIVLLSTILDYSGEAMKDFFGSFYDFFAISIQDPSKDIRVETVKCLVVLFDNIAYMSKDQINKYKELIPTLLQILDSLVQEGDEDNVHLIFEGFSFLADSKLTILDSHFKVIVEYCCSAKILMNNNMPFILKESVCDLIYCVAEKHRSVFNKDVPLIEKVVETMCIMISTPQTQEQLEEANGENIQDCCLWLVLMLSVHLNKKKIFTVLLKAITALINTNEPNQQTTGYLILAQMSEGCVDQLIKNISNPIMNDFIPRGLTSTHPEVKGACIKAIGFFAEWLGTSIIEYHGLIVPEIIKSFNDLNQKIQEKAMITLDVFCDAMEQDQLLPYLGQLIPSLVQVPYIENVSMKTKRAAMSCIASCISTSEEQFREYVPQVYKVIQELIMMKETPETDAIKSEAINALSKIALHFSKNDQEIHTTVVQPCMEKIFDLISNYGSFEINEGCFSFFYNLAEAIGAEFGPIFDKVIEVAFTRAASNEGIQYKKEGGAGDFSLDSDSEDETQEATGASIKQGFLDEKGAAIHALGQFAVSCPLKFQAYFERAIALLDQTYDYFHDNIRSQTMVCYKDLCLGMVKCANGGEYPAFDKGLPVVKRFDPKIEEVMLMDIWQKFCHSIRQEAENDVVAQSIEGLTQLVKKLGPAYIHSNLDDLYDIILDLLEGKCQCQNPGSDDEEDDDETDGLVFECLTDLVPAVAGALQAGFELGYKKLYPSLMAYTNVEKDINYRVQIIGCFAQIFKKGHKSLIQLSLEHLLPTVLNSVSENDEEISRNAVFCLGLMVQKGSEFMNQQNFDHIMIALKHVFESIEDQACKDNTAAALCRMIMTIPQSMPIDTAMDSVLAIAPFQGDEEEEKTLLQCLVCLADSKGEYLQKNIEKVVMLFVDGLSKLKAYKIKPAQQAVFVDFVKKLAQNYKDLVEGVVMKLGEKEKNEVIKMLS